MSISEELAKLSPEQQRAKLAHLLRKKALPSKQAPLSFAQERLWFLDQLQPGDSAYNMPVAVRLTGRLDVSAIERSLAEIVRRHETLRTTFAIVGGRPTQIIAPRLTLTPSLIDLREVPQAEREAWARQLGVAEAQRPFDLARGPLVRATLLRLNEEEHVLLLTMHHIISDGWSLGVLIREMATLYAAAPLPELPIQYADFARWQRRVLSSDASGEKLTYWQRQLAGPLPVLELGAPPAPGAGAIRGARQTRLFSPPLVQALKSLSQQAGATLFMTLLAALKVLLYRYTGQTDIVIGSPIGVRDRAELEGSIGLFLNTLVLRTDLSGNPTFLELLNRVRQVVFDAFNHKDLPFEWLVEKLQPERNLNRNPLFQVVFVMQNTPLPPLELPGLKLSLLSLNAGVEMNVPDMFGLSMRETEEGLQVILECQAGLSNLKTLDHLQTLLEAVARHPQQRLSDVPILMEAERRRLLVDWNATHVDYPDGRGLHHLFEAQVEETPEAIAAVFEDEHLSYAALNRRANQLAHHLRQLGVRPEVRVGICAERSAQMVVGLLGSLKAGGAYVPLDPAYPLERLAFMLADAGVSVLLTQATLADRLHVSPSVYPVLRLDADWPAIAQSPISDPPCPVSAEQLAYVIYTSGSTGQPKGAMNTHRGIVNRLLWMQDTYRLTPTDRVLQKTPFSFDVSVWEFFWPLLTGACLVLARPDSHKDSAYLVQTIVGQTITTLHFVPSMLRVFLEEPALEACRSLKRVICSGEALLLDLQARFFTRLEAELHNLYGPTEAAIDVTFWACQRESGQSLVPIGRPIANTQVYVLDAHFQPVPVSVAGELYLGGVGVGRGYLHRPDLTAERFIPNPFTPPPPQSETGGDIGGERLYRTGDLVRWLPDGILEFLGRQDDQVKLRGFRIELGEIEAVLGQQPDVHAAVVLAHEAQSGAKRLVAYVVPGESNPHTREAGDRLSKDALRDFLKTRLPDYMLPAAFVFLDTLPLTPSGKIDRRALRLKGTPDASEVERTQVYTPPETPLEEMLAEIWAQALEIDRIGIYDNVFKLGAHSLIAAWVIRRINEAFEVKLPLRNLFEEPTIAGLAVLIERVLIDQIKNQSQTVLPRPGIGQLAATPREQPAALSPSLVPMQTGETARQPLFFVHPVSGNVACYLDLLGRLGPAQPVYGLQSPGLDGREPPLTSIEDMARYYLPLVRSVQTEGPYRLGGWSMGGLVAFEMAQQLQAEGQTVELLALIDSLAPSGKRKPEPDDASLLKGFALDIGLAGRDSAFEAECLSQDGFENQLGCLLEQAKRAGVAPRDLELAQTQQLFSVFKSNALAMLRYRPGVYSGQVALFKAAQVLGEQALPEDMGWGAWVRGRLSVEVIPGTHYTLVREPNVETLADRLRLHLQH